ncbi:dihydrodipicolinate reductase C-terminal domain-containing protein [Rhodoferax sp.]|uniref:4-hydroxy-tetrahydrodipicolinate reductase n=1 Tax=Rhodoferax sp. TaxID=50421 RepID=UPI00262FC098|nr:dihydrodipicolinate reductase C-terminal domain-containing protein [Rhodoferax sp.]MDD4943823.1 dihydrodipicolinate reductase C-terminal domain-containing protein [Rhodoferax sp.]MDD5479586.1 dihydrodipicolinate reductase C-terminal domain-containing protein [Rhodoferax sp.]
MIKVGLVGFGKAGQAVATVLLEDPRYELCWIARQSTGGLVQLTPEVAVPSVALTTPQAWADWLAVHPVDALVDFSKPASLHAYGEQVRQRGLMLVSAISAYSAQDLAYAHQLGTQARVLCSPNITVGINFLILAARLLRTIAPFADVEILEQHFRDKPEVSGTARKIAQSIDVDEDRITSLRLGGIVGHHEVIFGFPYQTVRLIHNSIERRAFGTGAAFALAQLAERSNGFYTFDDLMMHMVRQELMKTPTTSPL